MAVEAELPLTRQGARRWTARVCGRMSSQGTHWDRLGQGTRNHSRERPPVGTDTWRPFRSPPPPRSRPLAPAGCAGEGRLQRDAPRATRGPVRNAVPAGLSLLAPASTLVERSGRRRPREGSQHRHCGAPVLARVGQLFRTGGRPRGTSLETRSLLGGRSVSWTDGAPTAPTTPAEPCCPGHALTLETLGT